MRALQWPWRSASPSGWLNSYENGQHLTGLVRLIDWRSWSADVLELAVAFGKAEQSPIKITFNPHEAGVLLEAELPAFQMDQLCREVLSIQVSNFHPVAGWWWLDLECLPAHTNLYIPTPAARPLSVEEAQFISKHPAPEELL